MSRSSTLIPLLVVAPLLWSCGGSSAPSGAAPTPTPTVTLTPTPTPSPTPTGTPASVAALVGGAKVGEALVGSAICDGRVQYGTNGFAISVADIGRPYGYADALQIYFSAADRMEIDTARFPFGVISVTSTDSFVSHYGPPDTDLQLPRLPGQLEFATLGQVVLYDELCYFALALDAKVAPPTSGQHSYGGLVDGFLLESGGANYRLFGSEANLTFISGASYRLTMTLRGRAQPFGDLASQAVVNLGTVTATVDYSPASGTFSLTSPPTGSSQAYLTGRLEGQLFLGAVFTFHIVDANGRVYYGAAAMDGALI